MKQIQQRSPQRMDKLNDQLVEMIFPQQKPQSYHCPCGKSYKSNSALVIHIKNKHCGKAPGTIVKPTKKIRKSKGFSQTSKNQQLALDSNQKIAISISIQCEEQNITQSNIQHQQFLHKFNFIKQKMLPTKLNKTKINQIKAFTEMNVFLKLTEEGIYTYDKEAIHIGDVVYQFFNKMYALMDWNNFQQTYCLFMLFLEYISLTQNKKNVVFEGTSDLMCDHINHFMESGLAELSQFYEVNITQIFSLSIILEIFDLFFGWLMSKKYTNYKIKLNTSLKQNQTTNEQLDKQAWNDFIF